MKNSETPLYLSAREAAAELSVSPATLYAYVSRGLVRSEPVADGVRARRYRADDVRSLKERRAPMGETPVLKGSDSPALETSISTITERGPIYRGVDAIALSGSASLEQAATLLWDVGSFDPFTSENLPDVSPLMRAVLNATDHATQIERAIAVLSVATDADPAAFNGTTNGRALTGARILRLVTAAMLKTSAKADPTHMQIVRAWALNHPQSKDLIRRALVLLADHELNSSTFTVRCAASTGISLYDAVIAGLAALKGPRHGGVGPQASRLLETLLAGDPAAIIRDRVALGERFAGFGHMVYRDRDPRAGALLEALSRTGTEKLLASDIPAMIGEATGQFPNVDYALAVLRRALHMPAGSETVLFAIARTVGWIAHASEQLASRRLIRPRARYVGPAPRINR